MMLFAACLVPLDAGPRLRPSSLARIALTDGFLLRRPCRVAAPDAAPWIAGQRGGIHESDTSVLESSRGPLTIHWGWNRWITLSEARSQARSAQVTRPRALAALLVEKGL